MDNSGRGSPPKCITCHTQRRVQPDQCYFTAQITAINFECSL